MSIFQKNHSGDARGVKLKHSFFASRLTKALLIPVLALGAPLSYALTDAEIEAMFEKYEQKINALEKKLDKASKRNSVVYVQDLEKSVKRIERQMDAKAESKLRINGFITAQAQVANEDLGTQGISEDINFRGNSKAGVQLSYQLNDKADATIQMVARSGDGDNDTWNVNIEWAYLGYQITDSLKVRAGRLRLPLYMYSDTLDVGYAYPWARPPLDMYAAPLNNYDGVDLLYNFQTGALSNSLQVWAGSMADTSDNDDLMLEEIYGANLTSSWGDFSARGMYFSISIDGTTTVEDAGSVSFPGGVGPCPPFAVSCTARSSFDIVVDAEDRLYYSAFGLNWDNGEYFVIAETDSLKSETGLFFKDQKGGYISAGTRMGDWTPFATHGWRYTTNETDFAATPVGGASSSRKTRSLGLRRELGAGLAATAQWDHYYNFNNSSGFFRPANNISDADVWTVSLDAVF